jgi:soluble lytic murein transglycosylase-like protein
MIRTILGVALGVIGGILLSYAFLAKGETLVYENVQEPEVVLIEVVIDWNEERINEEIKTVAEEYEVSEEVMHSVIRCESQYNPKALGDGGKSRGLVQIHSGYHDVSDEDAYDPAYAIRFLAQHLKEGNGHLWTCYRNLVN